MAFILEEEAQTQEKSPKKRFVLEEEKEPFLSGIKRKGKIAASNLLEGLSDPLSVVLSITPPGTFISQQKEKLKTMFQSWGLDAPEAENRAEEYVQEISKGVGGGLPFGGIPGVVSGITSAGREALIDLGVPKGAANIAEGVAGFALPQGLPGKAAKIKPPFKEARKVISKEGLTPVRGILKKEAFEKIKPITSESSLRNFNTKIEKSVKDASEAILEEALLGKQLEKQGTIIGDLIEDAYAQASNIGKTINRTADLSKVSTILGRKADKIEQSAPSLAEPTREIVKKLRKYQSDFASKRITPEQFENQYREVGKDLNNLYKKPELTGAEEQLRSVLEDTKDLLLKTAESKFKNPSYINSFKQANKLYSEARKLDKVNALIEPVFDKGFNPNRFISLFQSPKKHAELIKALGPRHAKRLRDISKYYVQPIEKMKKNLKVKDALDLEPILGTGIVAKLLGPVAAGGKFALVDLPPRVKAKLMMSENTQNLWLKFMKSLQHGTPKLIQKYVEELESDLSQED